MPLKNSDNNEHGEDQRNHHVDGACNKVHPCVHYCKNHPQQHDANSHSSQAYAGRRQGCRHAKLFDSVHADVHEIAALSSRATNNVVARR